MISFWRRALSLFLASLIACIAMLSFSFASTTTPFATYKAHAAPAPDSPTLLMIHGFYDTCYGAFKDPSVDAYDYFKNRGWPIDTVGFYGPNSKSPEYSCDNTILSEQNNCQGVGGIVAGNEGTFDDPIKHLGCMLAWYIYNNYSSQGKVVDVLAHSMGGLVIRVALGASSHESGFPPALLKVRRVVTVGTPHGGLDYDAFNIALLGGLTNTVQVRNMRVRSEINPDSLIPMLATDQYQAPQGFGQGTYWALMGSSGQCPADQQPDLILHCPAPGGGDRLLPPSSTLAMKANFKVLYGATGINGTDTVHYSHATAPLYFILSTPVLFGMFLPPFFLGDTTENTLAQAWVCWQSCNSVTDLNDLNTGSAGTSVRHSLSEMAALLEPSQSFSYAATNIDGRMEFFFITAGGYIKHSWQPTIADPFVSPDYLQSSPVSMGTPVVGENANGLLEVFMLDVNGHVWHSYQQLQLGWSPWSELPPTQSFTDGLTGIRNRDGRMEIFAHDANNRIWHLWQNAPNSDWTSGWIPLPSPGNGIASAPAIAVNPNGDVDVVARDPGGNMWNLGQSSPGAWWNAWKQLATTTTFIGNPAVGIEANGALEIFARGTNNNIWRSWRDSPTSGHSLWHEIQPGDTFQSDPVVGQNVDGHLEIFARDNSNNIWHSWQAAGPNANNNNGWNNYWNFLANGVNQSLSPGGYFSNNPAILHRQSNHNDLTLVAQDSNRHWWTIDYDYNYGWPTDWTFI